MKHVHFIGIGGVGMSGLAQILVARGDRVSGSDPQQNAATNRLQNSGATVYSAQVAQNITQERPDLVVVTAAVKEDNPELSAAREQGIPTFSRAEYLGALMEEHSGPRIAVTGTHGKTTTTAMIAAVLMEAGLDPTVLVGGEYPAMGGNVRVGKSGMIVTEACEAYDSFLQIHPDIGIITNIEADHLDHYVTEERVFESFERYVVGMKPSSLLIACGDDPGVQRLLGSTRRDGRNLTYGLRDPGSSSIIATDITRFGLGISCIVKRRSDDSEVILGELKLCVPGRHNILNALAVVALASELRIPFETVARALVEFHGAERRFQLVGEYGGVLVVDDYAHHPTEIDATIAAARSAYPNRRLIIAFQPHMYSRTRDFLDQFAQALSEADGTVIADIYAAREKPIPGVRSSDLVRRIAQIAPAKTVLYAGGLSEVVRDLRWIARPGDLVITMGAGDINDAGTAFIETFPSSPDRTRQSDEQLVGKGS
jgi:UDP-N-acetylmuramate--alanine ligase